MTPPDTLAERVVIEAVRRRWARAGDGPWSDDDEERFRVNVNRLYDEAEQAEQA